MSAMLSLNRIILRWSREFQLIAHRYVLHEVDFK